MRILLNMVFTREMETQPGEAIIETETKLEMVKTKAETKAEITWNGNAERGEIEGGRTLSLNFCSVGYVRYSE